MPSCDERRAGLACAGLYWACCAAFPCSQLMHHTAQHPTLLSTKHAAHCSASSHLQVHIIVQLHVAGVDAQHFQPTNLSTGGWQAGQQQ